MNSGFPRYNKTKTFLPIPRSRIFALPILLCLVALPHIHLLGQVDSLAQQVYADSVALDSLQILGIQDSLSQDSLAANSRQQFIDSLKASSDIQSVVEYRATDSIVFDMRSSKLFMYSDADLKQAEMQLKAYEIQIDWDTQTLYAEGRTDSTGELQGQPVFTESGQEYNARAITYNFKTQKGRIIAGRTIQGQEFLLSDTTKRMSDGSLFAKNAKITSCDLDEPHYYIRASRIKMLSNNSIVSGPLNLVIADFPLPVVIPFGYIPDMKSGRRSGVIIPKYGEAQERGFFLREMGYYWGINDFVDLTVLGDIYTKGGWRTEISSRFNKKNGPNGNISIAYGVVRFGEKGDPDFSETKEWRLAGGVSAAIDPTLRLSGSANITSSNRYNRRVSFNPNDFFQNNLNSSLNLSKRFNNLPVSMNMTVSHRQDLNKETVSMTLPTLTVNVNRLTPFKNVSDKKSMEWLTRLGLNYNAQASNQLSTVPDSLFLPILFSPSDSSDLLLPDSTIVRKRNSTFFRNGVSHRASASTNIKVLKFINVSTSFNYDEYWYTKTIDRTYNVETREVEETEVPGFAAARQYSTSVGASTNFYGIYRWTRSRREVAFRQRLTPTVSYNLRPDFSDPSYGYYQEVQTDSLGTTRLFNRFDQGIFGSPSRGESQAIGFGLTSVLEMKYRSKESFEPDFDEAADKFERITLLDNLSLNGSYNLAADSFQLSSFRLSARTSLFERKLNINASATLDPYALDSEGRKIDEFLWTQERKLGRLTNAQISLSTSLNGKSTRNKKKSEEFDDQEFVQIRQNLDQYVDFDIPWDVRLNYNLSYTKFSQQANVTQTLRMSGSMNFTPKWKIQFNSGYDIKRQQATQTSFSVFRDLHCWDMSFSWVPFGPLQSYVLTINVRSPTLRDLRLQKRNQWQDRRF